MPKNQAKISKSKKKHKIAILYRDATEPVERPAAMLPPRVLEALNGSTTAIEVEFEGTYIEEQNGLMKVSLRGDAAPRMSPSPEPVVAFDITRVDQNFNRVEYIGLRGFTSKESTGFQVTDKALGLIKGNKFRDAQPGENPGCVITRFTSQQAAAPVVAGTEPDIDHNPYNFVAFPPDASAPWLDQPPASGHNGHTFWMPDLLCGTIRFELKALTPVFVPAGFPWRNDRTPRNFCTLHKGNQEHFAIPASSFKGPLRAMVEAVANDYFGVANKDEYKTPIPYRRRVFNLGRLQKRPDDDWTVSRGEDATDETLGMFLFDRKPFGRSVTSRRSGGGPDLVLRSAVVRQYHDNLKNPHFRRYHEKCKEEADKIELGTPIDPNFPRYQEDLRKVEFDDVVAHLSLHDGDWIYYTSPENSGEIDSFGKNVYYLWPARYSVSDLAKPFFPPARNLNSPLGLADRMFGFASGHSEDSHPLRGKLRFETLWGPKTGAAQQIELSLAPLTSPTVLAKARPLYLEPGSTENRNISANYWPDAKGQRPKLRGRKFYWRQNSGKYPVWPLHLARPGAHKESQLPAPVSALAKDTVFTGRIHFRNLSREELGALLFVLEGGDTEGVQHSLQLGKGKPRGLGTLKVDNSTLSLQDGDRVWQSLSAPSAVLADAEVATEGTAAREAFAKWCLGHCGSANASGDPSPAFLALPHIRDFIALNKWPSDPSVRYYPLHFSDYTWLPEDNTNPDYPKAGRKVKAMKLARSEWRPPA